MFMYRRMLIQPHVRGLKTHEHETLLSEKLSTRDFYFVHLKR